MKEIGFIFLDFDHRISSEIVQKTQERIGRKINVYENRERNGGSYVETVDRALERNDRVLFFLDARYDGSFSDFHYAIREMYESSGSRIFVFTNFDGFDDDSLAELYNTVGNVMLDCGYIDSSDDLHYRQIFFSVQRMVAFERVYHSDSDNADAFFDLLQ